VKELAGKRYGTATPHMFDLFGLQSDSQRRHDWTMSVRWAFRLIRLIVVAAEMQGYADARSYLPVPYCTICFLELPRK